MTTLVNDVKYACRTLIKRPRFAAIAVVTLAIAIGTNTMMFSVVNALALRPVDVKAPDELVICKTAKRFGDRFDHALFERIREDNAIFGDLMAFAGHDECTLKLGDVSTAGRQTFVSSNYFSVLGTHITQGRGFLPHEEAPGVGTVGVLGHHTWRRLGADPDAIGRSILVNGHPCWIVGIAPKGFSGPTLIGGPDIWLPLGAHANMLSEEFQRRRALRPGLYSYPAFLKLVGRLKPDLPLATARAQFKSLSVPLLDLLPSYMREQNKNWHLQPLPRMALGVSDDAIKLPLICSLLMGAGISLLCIACLNLGNMYIVQGASRHRELAIRAAMGGSRLRIIRQLMAEALVLASCGGVLGVLVAYWSMAILNGSMGRPAFLQSIQFHLDANVLLASVGFSLAATILSGLWPALRLSRRDIMTNLKEMRGGMPPAARRSYRFMPRGLPVAGQIALSAVLLTGAALFTHSAYKAAFVTPGYRFDGKLVADIDLRVEGHTIVQRQQLCRDLVEHMRSLPEIQAAGLARGIPFADMWGFSHVALAGADDGREADRPRGGIPSKRQRVAGDYFQSMGLPLLQGRYFTLAESTTPSKVAIVDEALARQLRPDGDVLGRLLRGSVEIVGIISNVRHHIFHNQADPHVYYPLDDPMDACLLVRMTDVAVGNERAVLKRIRGEIGRVHPDIAVISACTLSDRHKRGMTMWAVRMMAGLSLVFGVAALFLATLGVYGVKGYMVATRIPEFGIRIALGATRRNIVSMVFRDGMLVTLIGLTIGMAIALACTFALGNLFIKEVLCDVDPVDPLGIVLTVLLLTLASLLAGYLPARRAARIDPMDALRCE